MILGGSNEGCGRGTGAFDWRVGVICRVRIMVIINRTYHEYDL